MLKNFLIGALFCIAPYASARAVTCNVGEYLVGEFCRTCPANATCNDGTEFVCNDGWYKSGSICAKCSVENSTCTGADDYSCMPGFYDDGKRCAACMTNAVCDGGDTPWRCADGAFKQIMSNGDFVSCLPCDGHVCDGDKLISCAEGYYFYKFGGYCFRCGQNSYCPAGSTQHTCLEGFYSKSSSCLMCPTGYFCPFRESTDSNKYTYCAAGYYKVGSICILCPDNVVCPGGKIQEMTCPDGLYRYDDGRCMPYVPGDCGMAPNCNPGCYENNGECTKCAVDHATCTDADNFSCDAGYYKNGASCDACPANSECHAGSEQISCLPGYWLDGEKCANCGADYWCNDNNRNKCPAHTADNLYPAMPAEYSVKDLSMTYVHNIANGAITDCAIYQPTFSSPAGEFFLWNAFYTQAHYRVNWNGLKYWYVAATGYYLDTEHLANGVLYYEYSLPCTNAPDNAYYTGAGTPGGNDCPWVCNDGYYRDGDICKVCPEGMDCLGGQLMCAPGLYAFGGQCLPCPAGYADSPNRGAQSENECQIKCAYGTYLPVANTRTCEHVGPGYWNGENYTNWGAVGTRNQCPAGLTTIGYGVGADEAGDCGRVLHIGEYQIYLRTDKKTERALQLYDGQRTYYGNVGADSIGHMHIMYEDGSTFSVYDDITATGI